MMQHKRGKVEAYEWWGTPCACLTPDTMRLPHARHHALASRGISCACLTGDIMRLPHARHHALASRPTPCACLTPQLMREGEDKLLMREGEDKHEGGGGQAARPAGRWPSRKSPYLTAPI